MTVASSSSPSSSLPSRAVVTVVAVAGFAALCQADLAGALGAGPGWWLAPVATFLGWAGAIEAARMADARASLAPDPLVPFATAALPLVAVAAAGGPVAAIGQVAVAAVIAVGLLFAVAIARYRPGGQALPRLAGGVFTLVAIGFPLAFMVGLRLVGAGARGIDGLVPLVSMVAVVKGGDIAAYLVGSAVGRHKLAPALSPGKTWEGAVASLAASLALAWLLLDRLPAATGFGDPAAVPWGGWPVYGLAVGVAGMLGDLSESLVKRELATKDSGRFLGGLGGILDLIDALLFAAPVAWLLWVCGGGR